MSLFDDDGLLGRFWPDTDTPAREPEPEPTLYLSGEDRENLDTLHLALDQDGRDFYVVGSALETEDYDDVDVLMGSREFVNMAVPEYRRFVSELEVVADTVEEVSVEDEKGVYGDSYLEARYQLDVDGTDIDLLCATEPRAEGPKYRL